jgi:hypothetical protein
MERGSSITTGSLWRPESSTWTVLGLFEQIQRIQSKDLLANNIEPSDSVYIYGCPSCEKEIRTLKIESEKIYGRFEFYKIWNVNKIKT